MNMMRRRSQGGHVTSRLVRGALAGGALLMCACLVQSGSVTVGGMEELATVGGDPPDALRLDLLKDARICPDGQGAYYLTGTAGTLDRAGRPDFDYNQGVPLWRSADLKTWQCLGFAWDRVAHFGRGRPKLGIWTDWSAPAGRIDGLLAQATTTPGLHRIGDGWYIICAMNGQNIILQKSVNGKPEGPYDDFAYLATRGGTPSLFPDGDAVYLVFADGWIAPLADDLHGLAEPPRPLLPEPPERPGSGRLTLGDAGVSLFKRDGRYCVLAARWQVRDGKPSHDAVLWTAGSLYGPYRETSVVLAGTGPVSVFRDYDGAWHAVSSRPCDGAPRVCTIPADGEEVADDERA